jgi:cyclopropane fatty-acyl-phospholipid synthase-like methyltransferase
MKKTTGSALALVLLMAVAAPAQRGLKLDVPYVPTPQPVVEAMLKLADVHAGDVVYDLGCGDGRIVLTAVKQFRAKRGLGIDLDPDRVAQSQENAKKAGMADKVEFRQGDVLKLDSVAEATVVALYLSPNVNRQLEPMLRKTLKPGSRVVSHDFKIGDWPPVRTERIKGTRKDDHVVYLWTVK